MVPTVSTTPRSPKRSTMFLKLAALTCRVCMDLLGRAGLRIGGRLEAAAAEVQVRRGRCDRDRPNQCADGSGNDQLGEHDTSSLVSIDVDGFRKRSTHPSTYLDSMGER